MIGMGCTHSARVGHGLRHVRKSLRGKADTSGTGISPMTNNHIRDIYICRIQKIAEKARIYNARNTPYDAGADGEVVANPCHPCTRAALLSGGVS